MILLFSGYPATGKSTFCRYLTRTWGFAHYDLEHHPEGWPHPEFQPMWDTDRATFVDLLGREHDRVALDWGFPPHCLGMVEELLSSGVRLVWFTASNVCDARIKFIERGGNPIAFEQQMKAIQEAGLPRGLSSDSKIVETIDRCGQFIELERIASILRLTKPQSMLKG